MHVTMTLTPKRLVKMHNMLLGAKWEPKIDCDETDSMMQINKITMKSKICYFFLKLLTIC